MANNEKAGNSFATSSGLEPFDCLPAGGLATVCKRRGQRSFVAFGQTDQAGGILSQIVEVAASSSLVPSRTGHDVEHTADDPLDS
jgi:hypothetical protein